MHVPNESDPTPPLVVPEVRPQGGGAFGGRARVRRRGLLFPVVALSLAVMVLFQGCATPEHRTVNETLMVVLTYNIHHGEGVDTKLDLERIAGVIRGSGADLVAIQEVDRNAERTGRVDQAMELARRTGLHGVYGKAMDFQGGGYGQVILSRWPIQSHEVIRLPGKPGREPRIALRADIAVPGRSQALRFVTTHLDASREDADRVLQGQALALAMRQGPPGAAIVAGDFNAVPESRTIQAFLGEWTDAAAGQPQPTIPAEAPRRRIDYVFLRPGQGLVSMESEVLAEPVASDHRPVRVVVRWAAP